MFEILGNVFEPKSLNEYLANNIYLNQNLFLINLTYVIDSRSIFNFEYAFGKIT